MTMLSEDDPPKLLRVPKVDETVTFRVKNVVLPVLRT